METYVLGETEVKKTGRVATKPLPGGKLLTMCEVTPVSDNDGTWKKFVNPNALLTISDSEEPK